MKLILYTWFVIFTLAGFICWLWVKGIEHMNNENSDYKGEDFFDEQ